MTEGGCGGEGGGKGTWVISFPKEAVLGHSDCVVVTNVGDFTHPSVMHVNDPGAARPSASRFKTLPRPTGHGTVATIEANPPERAAATTCVALTLRANQIAGPVSVCGANEAFVDLTAVLFEATTNKAEPFHWTLNVAPLEASERDTGVQGEPKVTRVAVSVTPAEIGTAQEQLEFTTRGSPVATQRARR
jgi:hypothetical protein